MNLPAHKLDTLCFGDARVGAETIEAVRSDSRLALGMAWLVGSILSQDKNGLSGKVLKAVIDDIEHGDWSIDITVSNIARHGDPAHRKRLKIDGQEIIDVLEKVDTNFGLDIYERIWRLSSSLLIQATVESNISQWSFPTPLGRMIDIRILKIEN